MVEDERAADGQIARVATVFLTGRECPWRCVMCDLWHYTTPTDTPPGAIEAQLTAARQELARRAEPVAGSSCTTRRTSSIRGPCRTATIQASPRRSPDLTGSSWSRTRRSSAPASTGFLRPSQPRRTELPPSAPRGRDGSRDRPSRCAGAPQQTDDRRPLRESGRRAEDARRRVARLSADSPAVRPAGEQDAWLLRSVDAAFRLRATAVSLIPTRAGNGALEALSASGDFARRRSTTSSAALDSRSRRRHAVASSWISGISSGLRIVTSASTPGARACGRINLEQRWQPLPACERCSEGGPGMTATPSAHHRRRSRSSSDRDSPASLTALALRRRGRRVALVERGRHPRFAIGESSTPLANLLIEEIADRYDLPRIRAFSKWGTWQRDPPDVAGGLKRGFTFFFHRPGERFADDESTSDSCWSPPARTTTSATRTGTGPTSTTRWSAKPRRRASSTWTRRRSIASPTQERGVTLEGARHGQPVTHVRAVSSSTRAARADFSIGCWTSNRADRLAAADAGALHAFRRRRAVGSPQAIRSRRRRIPRTPRRCIMCSTADGSGCCGSTTGSPAPAPRSPIRVAAAIARGDARGTWDRLLAMLPSVQDQFRNARPVLPFVHAPRLAFRSRGRSADRDGRCFRRPPA